MNIIGLLVCLLAVIQQVNKYFRTIIIHFERKIYILYIKGYSTATTVTITTSPDGTTTVTTSTDSPVSSGAAAGVLSDNEVALIRESWAIAKDIPAIQTRTLLE